MKINILIILYIICNSALHAQPNNTNYGAKITKVEWAPNGKWMVLSIRKLDSTGKPSSPTKAYWYDIKKKTFEVLYNGGAGAVSPDGKTIAFSRRLEGNRVDIYLYNRITKTETVLGVDTANLLFSPAWSVDGQKIAFNRQVKKDAPIQIVVADINTKKIISVIEDGTADNYNPKWCPVGNTLVYYKEKGDKRDQIYLTDDKGSYHKNITNDTTTYNYYPNWVDAKTVFYTQDPDKTMIIKTDGTGRLEIDGVLCNEPSYNRVTKQFAYIDEKSGGALTVYNIKKKTKEVLLSNEDLKKYKL